MQKEAGVGKLRLDKVLDKQEGSPADLASSQQALSVSHFALWMAGRMLVLASCLGFKGSRHLQIPGLLTL